MTAVALCSWIVLLAAALMLASRIGAAQQRVRTLVFSDQEGEALPLADVVCAHVDATIVGNVDHAGLSAVPIPFRESQDPYRTVDDLLAWLVRQEPTTTLKDHERRVRAVYHLAAALALPPHATQRILSPVIDDLRAARYMDRPVGDVSLVTRNALVDRRTMWPMTAGTRVRQPLGVVVKDTEGTVVSKARVACQ